MATHCASSNDKPASESWSSKAFKVGFFEFSKKIEKIAKKFEM
jgi:hypothetical protein